MPDPFEEWADIDIDIPLITHCININISPAEEEAGPGGVQVRGRGAQAGAAESAGRVLHGDHHPDPGEPWPAHDDHTDHWPHGHQALSVQETEVLFLVLTHIQRDLMAEAPGQMSLIVNCIREAFLMSEAPQQVVSVMNTMRMYFKIISTTELSTLWKLNFPSLVIFTIGKTDDFIKQTSLLELLSELS